MQSILASLGTDAMTIVNRPSEEGQITEVVTPADKEKRLARIRSSLAGDMREALHFVDSHGFQPEISKLHQRASVRSLAAIATDWFLIALSMAAVLLWGVIALPAAVLIVGRCQRALVVLIHDASHYALHRNKLFNNLLAKLLLCWPMWTSLARYRTMHTQHHRNLGDPEEDTDYLHHDSEMSKGSLKMYWDYLCSSWSWNGGFGEAFAKLNPTERVCVASWWACVSGLAASSLGIIDTLTLCGVWLLSRATVYHAIISFVIISDHVGLQPGSVLGFARNHCIRGPLTWFIHPHSNGLHLTHHLMPGLPFYNLQRAHQILMEWPAYAAASHCTSYFSGPRSAMAEWTQAVDKMEQPVEALRNLGIPNVN